MEGGGVKVRAEPSRRPRLALFNQMSTIAAEGRDLSGLTLDEILNLQKRTTADSSASAAVVHTPPPPLPVRPSTPGRTLLDIIRDEDPKNTSFKGFGGRDKKAWRSFKDRLRLRRSGSGAAWTSSLHVPTSDILFPTSRSLVARRNSVRNLFSDSTPSPPPRRSLEMVMTSQPGEYDSDNDNNNNNTTASPGGGARPQISRRTSSRFVASPTFSDNDDHSDPGSDNSPSPRRRGGFHQAGPSLRPQISRRHSTRFATAMDDNMTDPTEPPPPQRDGSRRLSAVLAEERSLSAREAVAAQEAAEAAASAASEDSEVPATEVAPVTAEPVRMSLMDLLEETDRQMGLVGSRYVIGEENEEDEYEEEEVEEMAGAGVGATTEQTCCVCMIRHKGAAFIPCGHTFCRLCSRELWVSRGNCPLCNGFILEILDIF